MSSDGMGSASDPFWQNQKVETIREQTQRVELLERLLRSAPVLSQYHGPRGFETERFILDFEAWRAECRLALSAKTA